MVASRSPLLLAALAAAPAGTAAAALCASVEGFEAEHLSVLRPAAGEPEGGRGGQWTPPVLDPGAAHLFAWRVAATAAGGGGCDPGTLHPPARNVTQVGAVLTLTAVDHPGSPPVVCHPNKRSDLSLLCGAGAAWLPAARYAAKLEVTLRDGTSATATATAEGMFIQGLEGSNGWGGAEWIGLADANDTASQFRGAADTHAMGFRQSGDVARAVLFVAGLGGYRASVNGRAIDPTSVRASVTEWHNRTLYFADDVTADLAAAAAGNGSVVVAIEMFKHWWGLSNNFYEVPYGPRSLKAVLALTHANGSSTLVLPTGTSAASGWRHGSGSLLFDDLHKGQEADGRLATPRWQLTDYRVDPEAWNLPLAVPTPPGELRPHPMYHSRVLERLAPVNVSRVPSSEAGTTYRFTLPYEVAGFCTLLLPRGCPAGASVTFRHGECVYPKNNTLLPVEAPSIEGSATDTYTCRGDATGLSAHEISWRRLAVGGDASGAADAPDREAFTPSFTFSAFKYIEVSYSGADEGAPWSLPPPDAASLSCSRVGAGVDWTGDVAVAAADEPPAPGSGVTPAQRFNAVIAAARSTAIANYVMDIPTDSPQEEKRGWCGDSLATHRTYASFFDMRAAWIKWTEDVAATASVWKPAGAVPAKAPCIMTPGVCVDDPRGESQMAHVLTGTAWGSLLPQLSAFTAALTEDDRYASRMASAASVYVGQLQSYANDASYSFPELLNVSSGVDNVNVGKQGWPASAYGDWCPTHPNGYGDHPMGQGACTSVSALLNSVYFILDMDAAAALLRVAGKAAAGGDHPSEAQFVRWAAMARKSFMEAFLHRISVPPLAPSTEPISGLSFRDLQPPNVTHHGNPSTPPSAQAETASGMAVMDRQLTDDEQRAALGGMLAGLLMNVSADVSALQVGGVIDMAQFGRSAISYGRPDALFALLSTDGPTSFYHMTESTGTFWAHPGGGDGSNGACSSHNHVMQAGSVGEAIFGIGGIRPAFVREMVPEGPRAGEHRLLLAPIPWLPEAPRGAAVWRTKAGVASTAWSASAADASGQWSVWVNVTVPAGSGSSEVQVMLPQSAQRAEVCAWECGGSAGAFTEDWVAFDGGGGHRRFRALAPAASPTLGNCAQIWKSGSASGNVAGVGSVEWGPAVPGTSMFPALSLEATSGSFAVYARSC